MFEKNSQIEKMLRQQIAQQILGLLVKEDLSISQISDKLENTDMQMLIAYFTELQRLGLIIPASNDPSERKTNNIEDNLEKTSETLQIPRHEWFSPLGLALPQYNALWEEISEKKGISNPKILDNLIFAIPDTLKEYLKKNNPNTQSEPTT